MSGKHIAIISIIIILAAGGTAGAILIGSSGNGSTINEEELQTRNNNTASQNSATGADGNEANTDWELILSENNTFVDGDTGHGSDTLTFNIDSAQRLNIKMHIVSELCVACGGNGKGEVTLLIQSPTGDAVHRDVYTASSDLNLIWDLPQKGEWQISIDGVAVGDAYRIGYSAQVLVIGS
jgi:hypothetical protein